MCVHLELFLVFILELIRLHLARTSGRSPLSSSRFNQTSDICLSRRADGHLDLIAKSVISRLLSPFGPFVPITASSMRCTGFCSKRRCLRGQQNPSLLSRLLQLNLFFSFLVGAEFVTLHPTEQVFDALMTWELIGEFSASNLISSSSSSLTRVSKPGHNVGTYRRRLGVYESSKSIPCYSDL